ncbi:MAG TPA: ADP-ribosylglycohydrolase family protein, partial [Armatimonadota bacterium]|nr:ADP-ribosylglycohydrolase family protein [Armatimonadota bacterium]
RLTENIETIIALRESGASFDEAIADVRTRWNEDSAHDWCHTISNAEVCAVSLLWGDLDFEKSICMSVMPGFDTDCNGATVGSVVGLMLGAEKLPAKWIDPMNDTLITGVAGYHRVSLTQMADETVELIG